MSLESDRRMMKHMSLTMGKPKMAESLTGFSVASYRAFGLARYREFTVAKGIWRWLAAQETLPDDGTRRTVAA